MQYILQWGYKVQGKKFTFAISNWIFSGFLVFFFPFRANLNK